MLSLHFWERLLCFFLIFSVGQFRVHLINYVADSWPRQKSLIKLIALNWLAFISQDCVVDSPVEKSFRPTRFIWP